MKRFTLNPFARAQRAEQNAAALSTKLIETVGRNFKLESECLRRGAALQQIVAVVDGTNAPNGTSRKVRNIAFNGLSANN